MQKLYVAQRIMGKKNKKVSLGKKPFLVLSRRAIAGWLVVVFFVCAWMFTIGVLVGRGTSPLKIDINELQKKLAAAKEELKRKYPGRTRSKPEIVKDKTDLEFYEALQEKRQAPKSSKQENWPISSQKTDPPSVIEPPKSTKVSQKRLTKTQNRGKERADTTESEPSTPSEAQPNAAKIRAEPTAKLYTIQVAAFKAAGDADKLVAELKQKGYGAYRVIGKVPGKGLWYRVRVGRYNDRAKASSTIAKLKKAGKKPILLEK